MHSIISDFVEKGDAITKQKVWLTTFLPAVDIINHFWAQCRDRLSKTSQYSFSWCCFIFKFKLGARGLSPFDAEDLISRSHNIRSRVAGLALLVEITIQTAWTTWYWIPFKTAAVGILFALFSTGFNVVNVIIVKKPTARNITMIMAVRFWAGKVTGT